MKKFTKKNRKYLIGGGKITSVQQFQRVAQAFLRRYPSAQSIRVTYCGKVKVFDLKRFPLV
jgi:hypothetical protein